MEKALIEAILNKKKSAFSIFYNDIVDHFYSFLKTSYNLSQNEINDIISETFIKIWTKLDSFKKEKGNFVNWCWTILRNTTKDYFKSKKEYQFSDLVNSQNNFSNFEEVLEDDINMLKEINGDYQINQIQKALNKLNYEEKEIIYLRYTEGKKLEEIAFILGISYANVRVKLYRIIKKLKKNLSSKM